jgi:hypothetical protein
MSDPAQNSLTDRMIARLEEANTRSYKQLKGADESFPRSEQDSAHRPSDGPATQKRRASRARLWLFAFTGLVLAATVYAAAVVWEPVYGVAIVRWVNASILLPSTRQNDASPEPIIPPEVERRLQRMADELADAQWRIEQLKVGQGELSRNSAMLAEQSKAGHEQMARENANAVNELNAAVAKTARREEALAMQLKAAQEKLDEAAPSRSANAAHKLLRGKRARRGTVGH